MEGGKVFSPQNSKSMVKCVQKMNTSLSKLYQKNELIFIILNKIDKLQSELKKVLKRVIHLTKKAVFPNITVTQRNIKIYF